MPVVSVSEWEQFISQRPGAHMLQTAPWGALKSRFGWESAHLLQGCLGAQVLLRRALPGLRIAYLPKGPVGLNSLEHPDWPAFLHGLDALCRRRGAIFLKIEPDAWQSVDDQPLDLDDPSAFYFPGEMVPSGLIESEHSIQPRRTLVVDLRDSDEILLNRMKQKTRYNIRVAQRHGVTISPSGDIPLFYQLMQSTGERDRFGIHDLAYYQYCYELFHPRGSCELLVASHQDTPLAALMVFAQGRRAWYFYGASASSQRDLMPTYLLQWEAMRWARQQGCASYDLWGVPDADKEELEAAFTQRSDGLWGVYRFKRGFGGNLRRAAGPWDRVYQPWLYKIYRLYLSRRHSVQENTPQ